MDVDNERRLSKRHSMQLKGKSGNRGWATLPSDVLKIVMNHLIREYDTWPMPQSWQDNNFWPNRLMYLALRSANYVHSYMHICRSWRKALNTHPFWVYLCNILDPLSSVLIWRKKNTPVGHSSAVRDIRIDFQNYYLVRMYACIACRMANPLIQNPSQPEGFGHVKRYGHTSHTGRISLCSNHKRNTFCGVCLRSELLNKHAEDLSDMAICETEDDEAFANVDATCTKCRAEALERRATNDQCLSECYQQLLKDSRKLDWEIRQSMESFIDFGEGSLSLIINTTWEKTWLRRNTKIAEYLDQAVASVKYQNREDGYDSEDEISDDDDVVVFQEMAVRDIAMGDYCRLKILDGHWTVPYDMFVALIHRHNLPVIRAFNPVPYMLTTKSDEVHPSIRTVETIGPPTPSLADSLSRVFQREMERVLAPALNNLVRKTVMECQRTCTDPSIRASRMDVEDILQGLREEGVWWDNYDWSGQWDEKERREQEQIRLDAMRHERVDDEETNSSASDYSYNSHHTSPVLSTSTLQTTPSPPPVEGFADKATHRVTTPTPPAPSLLRIVPYVPESSEHMPHNTRELLKHLWRDASSPLFHCKCTICTRAMSAEPSNAAANAVADIPMPKAPAVVPLDAFEDEEEDPELLAALALERELNSHVVPSQNRARSPSPVLLRHVDQSIPSSDIEDVTVTDYCDPLEETMTFATVIDDAISSPESTPTKREKLGLQQLSESQERLSYASKKRGSEEMDSGADFVTQKRRKSNDGATPRSLSRQGSYVEVGEQESERGNVRYPAIAG